MIAKGFYDPHSPLAFRVCTVEAHETLDDPWAANRMGRALALRQMLFDEQTTGFRLFNGEGDGLPGLICDIYSDTAVIQVDGAGPRGFWHLEGIAQWVAQRLSLEHVFHKTQSRSKDDQRAIIGTKPTKPVAFLENGVTFTADVIKGQKTGFFFDQRENRQEIKTMADNRDVLNLFGYTGGFSVYAGLGNAQQVTTVDIAAPAIEMATQHWQLNQLKPDEHSTVQADAFKFLEDASHQKKAWDLVIVDPPSFAPTQKAVNQAVAAYQKLIAAAAAITAPNGLLATASCSSHVDLPMFLNICETAISKARRRATILRVNTQPPDHPTPLPFSEGRYLKFIIMRVD